MMPPRFWQKRGVIAYLLAPLGMVYGAITLFRMQQKGFKAEIPVICVGNVTLGGTGKSPIVQALYQLLREMGQRPVILTRGYGGTQREALRVQEETAAQIGDEARMLANDAPVIVSANRANGAKLAQILGFSCIVMDDGFQNPQLVKDFSFLVFDKAGIGNGLIFPAGTLRAQLSPQLMRAHAIMMTGEGDFMLSTPLLRYETFPLATSTLPRETKLLAFCGIGRPQKFFKTLETMGFKTIETRSFPDHYAYTPADVSELKRQAKQNGQTLITTQKDAVKWPEPIETVVFQLKFKEEAAIKARLSALFI